MNEWQQLIDKTDYFSSFVEKKSLFKVSFNSHSTVRWSYIHRGKGSWTDLEKSAMMKFFKIYLFKLFFIICFISLHFHVHLPLCSNSSQTFFIFYPLFSSSVVSRRNETRYVLQYTLNSTIIIQRHKTTTKKAKKEKVTI